MRNELIDLYKLACANPKDKDIVLAYQRAKDRIGPQIAIHEAMENDALLARVARLEDALQKIADGRGMVPDKSTIYMNGSVPEVPKHFNVYDMREIARRALEEK